LPTGITYDNQKLDVATVS
jgi:hypothetical protein